MLPRAKNWWTLLHNAVRSSRLLFKCRIMQAPEWTAEAYDGSLHFLPTLLASRKYWRLELWSPHIIGAGKYETLRVIDCITLMIAWNKIISCWVKMPWYLVCNKNWSGHMIFLSLLQKWHPNCFETALLSLQRDLSIVTKTHVFVAEGSKLPSRVVYRLL